MQENNQKENLVLIEDLGMILIPMVSKERYGKYLCSCGKEFIAKTKSVKSGTLKHCGESYHFKSHKLRGHRLYRIWMSAKQRCFNKNSLAYKNYGERGITICKEWKNDFLSFYNWALHNGYKENLTIDRINNNGDYEPLNCRWVNMNIQTRNTRKIRSTNTSGYRGVGYYHRYKKYRATISINNKTIHIGYFNNHLEAAKAYDQYVIDNNLEHTKNF